MTQLLCYYFDIKYDKQPSRAPYCPVPGICSAWIHSGDILQTDVWRAAALTVEELAGEEPAGEEPAGSILPLSLPLLWAADSWHTEVPSRRATTAQTPRLPISFHLGREEGGEDILVWQRILGLDLCSILEPMHLINSIYFPFWLCLGGTVQTLPREEPWFPWCLLGFPQILIN